MARSDCEPCSRSASPAGSSNCGRGVTQGRAKETAIVVGSGSKNFNIRMGSSKGINLVFKGPRGGGGGGGGISISGGDGSCVTRTKQGGIQISAGGKSLEIALDGNGSIVSLGAPSGCAAKLYGCDSKASFNPRGGGATVTAGGKSFQLCLAGGKVQLNISGTGKCGSQVTYGGGNGGGIELTYGPLTKKIDLGHCKPTITHLIHKRMTELGKQMRLAECAYASLHPCPPPCIKIS